MMTSSSERSPEGPTVSALIPAYNAAETIERALDSVYAQTYDNIIEVIVVDDGSEDNTAEIVREKHPDVTLIRQENRGVGAARNCGLRHARGDLVAFLDADDEWTPVHVADLVQVATPFPEAGLLSAGYAFRPDDSVETVFSHASAEPISGDFLAVSQHLWIAHTSATAVKRMTALEVGGYREDMPLSEDTEFFARVYLSSDFGFHPRVSSVYHGGSGESAVRRHADTPASLMMFEALSRELDREDLTDGKRNSLESFLAGLMVAHAWWCLLHSKRSEAIKALRHPLVLAEPGYRLQRVGTLLGSLLPTQVLRAYARFRQSRWGVRRRVVSQGFVRLLRRRRAADN
jgi:glycosyltransferase involved in cell wall biosynthesis